MKLGCCYYPEHWPEEMWAEDARRMVDMGLSQVRIGEFSWSRIEPKAGHFQWEWLDRAIETLSGAGAPDNIGDANSNPAQVAGGFDARYGCD